MSDPTQSGSASVGPSLALEKQVSDLALNVAVLTANQTNDRRLSDERHHDNKAAVAQVSAQIARLETLMTENTKTTNESKERGWWVLVAVAVQIFLAVFLHFWK